jgi:hypothetical protein
MDLIIFARRKFGFVTKEVDIPFLMKRHLYYFAAFFIGGARVQISR